MTKIAILLALILPAPALAELKPEPHPSAKGKKVTTWAYDYWTTGTFTASDGTKITVRVKCHVDRKGRHSCRVAVPA